MEIEQGIVTHDINGQPILNSNGVPFDPPIIRVKLTEEQRAAFKVEWIRLSAGSVEK